MSATINYSYHGFDEEGNADYTLDGWVQWNGEIVTIPHGLWLNPGNTMPFYTVIYNVFSLTDSKFHDIALNSSTGLWEANTYSASGVPSARSTWTWSESDDIILSQYMISDGLVIYSSQLFTPPKKYSEIADSVSITGVTNHYLATSASSGVTKNTQGWTTTVQTMTAINQYLWNYETITGSNGQTISETDPIIIGRYGQDGQSGGTGRGIVSITEHYQKSSSSSTPPSTWSDTMVVTDPVNKYLWNYETITYTDGTTEDSSKRVIGTHGENGDKGDTGDTGESITVISTAYAYQLSTSGTTIPTGTWQTTPQAPTVTQYAWTRTTTTFSDNSTAVTYTVGGKVGTTGATGDTGTSVTVSSTVYAYQLSTSGTTIPTGTWQTSPQAPTTTQFAWTRTTTTFSDGSTAVTYTVGGKVGQTGATGATGARGTTWYSGIAITGQSTTPASYATGIADAIVGDHYLNTNNQNVFVCTTGGNASTAKWKYEQNIKGEQGTTGATGSDGVNSYFHVKYSDDGGQTFTGNTGEDPGDWIGTYTNNVQADSTDVNDYTWVKIKGRDAVTPIESRTYTDIIGTANDAANASFYFAKIHPTNYTVNWEIHLRFNITEPTNYAQTVDIRFGGYGSTFTSYDAYVKRNTGSLGMYYVNLYRATSTGISTNHKGHAAGFGLRNSSSPTSTSYKRTITVDLLDMTNCTIDFLDTAVKYANMDGTGSTNYSGLTEMGVATNGQNATNNANTNYTQHSNYIVAGANGIRGYSLVMRDTQGTWSSFCSGGYNGTATGKNPTDTGFILGPILYITGAGAQTSDSSLDTYYNFKSGVNASTPYDSYALDLRYSTNCAQTLTAHKPVYLVGHIADGDGEDGLFHLNNPWYTQTVPSQPDNNIYVYIGDSYSTYQVYLNVENTPYQFYKGEFRKYSEVLTMKADEAAAAAQSAADNAQTDIDNLTISGRNLYIVRDQVDGFINGSADVIAGQDATMKEVTSNFIPVTAGEPYSIQAWTPNNENLDTPQQTWLAYAFYTDADMSTHIGSRTAKYGTAGDTYIMYQNVIAPATANYIRVSYRTLGDVGAHTMIERSNRLNDWTPAPEDVSSDIANVSEALETLDSNLDQVGVFNRLTNNGAAEGLFLDEETGGLYINANYINSGWLNADRISGGTLTLGGEDNENGSLLIKDASGKNIGGWNNGGLWTNWFKFDTETETATIGTGGFNIKIGGKSPQGDNYYRIEVEPSEYTTQQGGFTPSYRVPLTAASSAIIGDNLEYNDTYYTVGYTDSSYIYLDEGHTPPEIGFYDADEKVAYVNNNTLHISQSVVLNEMQLGDGKWAWKINQNDDNIYLQWIG